MRIMLVENDLDDKEIFCEAVNLVDEEIEIVCCTDGGQALEYFNAGGIQPSNYLP